MIQRVETLKKDHERLRVLLRACESAGPGELPGLLRQLHDAFLVHQRAKEQLYDAVVAVCNEAKDSSSLTLLTVFRANLTVMSNAVHGFLVNVDPDSERLHQRFRSVATALRSMMDVEEKSVFPLCLRQHARQRPALSMDPHISLPPLRHAGGR